MRVEVRKLTKSFGSYRALHEVELEIVEGQFCALLGPSGSGKTTLLRIVAGLEFPDAGEVRFAGEDVLQRSSKDREVGFVFQHYALFRHMTVLENVSFGLRVRPRRTRPPRGEIDRRSRELLDLVQLQGLADRYPSQLSGGQRQRVALARALAIEPRVLLLDEPFGALDAKVRKELRRWLRDLHKRLGLTSIFVTHDQEEALELADTVVVMSQGRIEQIGSPREIYDHPATPFVYDFLGSANRFQCRIEGGRVEIEGESFPLPEGSPGDGNALLFVRPHDFETNVVGSGRGFPATVRVIVPAGGLVRLEVETDRDGQPVDVEISRGLFEAYQIVPGTHVALVPRRFGLFAAPDGVPPPLAAG
jgi:sulfate transport system ATP-binding protein